MKGIRLLSCLLGAIALFGACGGSTSNVTTAAQAEDVQEVSGAEDPPVPIDPLECDDDRRSIMHADLGLPGVPDPARATPLGGLQWEVSRRTKVPPAQSIAPVRTDGYWQGESAATTSQVFLDIEGRTKAVFNLTLHGSDWIVTGASTCAENEA